MTTPDTAAEFGALTKQGVDVRLALLVACSAFEGKKTDKINTTNVELGKTTLAEFAGKATTSDRRISRHLAAWNRAAERGWCKPASDLTPADADNPELQVPEPEDFRSVFGGIG